MKLPQFTLRDLFWLVLVCALAVGWLLSTMDCTRRLEEQDNESLIRRASEINSPAKPVE